MSCKKEKCTKIFNCKDEKFLVKAENPAFTRNFDFSSSNSGLSGCYAGGLFAKSPPTTPKKP